MGVAGWDGGEDRAAARRGTRTSCPARCWSGGPGGDSASAGTAGRPNASSAIDSACDRYPCKTACGEAAASSRSVSESTPAKCSSSRSARLGIALDQPLHRLEQIDVRAGQDLDARRQPPPSSRRKPAPSPLLQPELGVQIARVHDPELRRIRGRQPCRPRSPPRRSRSGSTRSADPPTPETPPATCRAASGVLITIAAADPSNRRIRRNLQPPMNPVGYIIISSNAHGSPRSAIQPTPSLRDERGAGLRGRVGRHDRVDRRRRPVARDPASTTPSCHHRSMRSRGASRRSRRLASACAASPAPGRDADHLDLEGSRPRASRRPGSSARRSRRARSARSPCGRARGGSARTCSGRWAPAPPTGGK